MRLKILTVLFLTGCFSGCGMLLFPWNVKIENPSQVVIDARRLIKEFRENPQKQSKADTTLYGCLPYEREDLPASLQMEIYYAFVCQDHVSLIFYRNPDADLGLRIWSEDAKNKGSDELTKWKDIY